MTVEFTARFDDSLSDYVKELVSDEVGDIDDKVNDKVTQFFDGYGDPTDYFDMGSFVTEDDAMTSDAVEELIAESDLAKTVTTLATTLQVIVDALVAGGFVPTGWQVIPKEVA